MSSKELTSQDQVKHLIRKLKREKDRRKKAENWSRELNHRNVILQRTIEQLFKERENLRKENLELQDKLQQLRKIKEQAQKCDLFELLNTDKIRIISLYGNKYIAKVLVHGQFTLKI